MVMYLAEILQSYIKVTIGCQVSQHAIYIKPVIFNIHYSTLVHNVEINLRTGW